MVIVAADLLLSVALIVVHAARERTVLRYFSVFAGWAVFSAALHGGLLLLVS